MEQTQSGACRLLVEGADGLCCVLSVNLPPALDHPCGMRVHGSSGIFMLRVARHLRKLAEDSVDHPRGLHLARSLCELHAFADRGMRRDAVEIEKLVCAEAQRGLDGRWQFCTWTRQQRTD